VCVGELLRVEDERRSLCRMMNVPTNVQGLERLLRWCDPSSTMQRRLVDCAERATRCRELNDRNGALVTARLKKVEGMLDVLTSVKSLAAKYGAGKKPIFDTESGFPSGYQGTAATLWTAGGRCGASPRNSPGPCSWRPSTAGRPRRSPGPRTFRSARPRPGSGWACAASGRS